MRLSRGRIVLVDGFLVEYDSFVGVVFEYYLVVVLGRRFGTGLELGR